MPGPILSGKNLKKMKPLPKGIRIKGITVVYKTKGGRVETGTIHDEYWCRSSKKGIWSKKDDEFDKKIVSHKLNQKRMAKV
ncbi:MAG: hypothetical protein QW051_00570 [Candidatus Aenigmatarchaeota archaeon]